MTESYLDGLLDELVRHGASGALGRRCSTARVETSRRYTAVVIAVAALGLAPAPGWPSGRSKGHLPRRRSGSAFEFLRTGPASSSRRGMGKAFPQAEVAKAARRAAGADDQDGPLDLWAAPATDGGACFLVGWEADRLPNLQVGGAGGCAPANHQHPIGAGTFQGSDHPYTVVYGYAAGSVATAQVKLWSGRTVTLPVVEHLLPRRVADRLGSRVRYRDAMRAGRSCAEGTSRAQP